MVATPMVATPSPVFNSAQEVVCVSAWHDDARSLFLVTAGVVRTFDTSLIPLRPLEPDALLARIGQYKLPLL